MSARSWLAALGYAVAVLAIAVGLSARLRTLDGRQLTTDEYYFLTSVDFVRESGLPRFPEGGYYTRGLLPQYLTAASIELLGDTPAAARLPALLFSLGTIVLAYLYARRFVSRGSALAVSVMLALSSWEIEFSGFARMYSALQFFTLLLALAIERGFSARGPARYLPLAVLAATALVHEQAILLAPLVFLPLLAGSSPRPGFDFALCAVVAIAVAAFAAFDFRSFGVSDFLPAGYVGAPAEALRLPAFPFWQIAGSPLASALAFAAALAAVAAIWLALAARRRAGIEHLWLAWLLTAALAHQLVVAGIAAAVFVLRYDGLGALRRSRAVAAAVGLAALASLGWLALGLSDLEAWTARVSPGDLPRTLRRTFFALPDFFDPLIVPWRWDLPVLTVLLAAVVGFSVVRRARTPFPDLLRGPLPLLAIAAVAVALPNTQLIATRYTFYVYPLLLTAFAIGFEDLCAALPRGRWDTLQLAPVATLLTFLAADDVHVKHLADPSRIEVRYRTGEFARYSRLWYQRIDFQSPAEWLNRELPDGATDPIIVVGQDPIAHSLQRPFAAYVNPQGRNFPGLSRKQGTRHIWSNAPLVTSGAQVRAYVGDATRLWIVQSVDPSRHAFEPNVLWADRFLDQTRVHVGEDGRLEVVAVHLAPSEQAREVERRP